MLKKIILLACLLSQFFILSAEVAAGSSTPQSDQEFRFGIITDMPGADIVPGCQWYYGKYGASGTFVHFPALFFDEVSFDAYWANCFQSVNGKGIGGYSFSLGDRLGFATRVRKNTDGLLKYGGDAFIHYDLDAARVSRCELIPMAEISSYKGLVDFPVDGWKTVVTLPAAVGAGFSPSLGITFDAGVWKTLFDKLIVSAEGTVGFPVSGYQDATTVFFLSYPGVKDITCDLYVTCHAGIDLVTGMLFAKDSAAYFGAFGLYAHAGYIDPDRAQGIWLPLAVEARFTLLISKSGTLTQTAPLIGLAYAFADKPSWGRENNTAKFFVGLNY